MAYLILQKKTGDGAPAVWDNYDGTNDGALHTVNTVGGINTRIASTSAAYHFVGSYLTGNYPYVEVVNSVGTTLTSGSALQVSTTTNYGLDIAKVDTDRILAIYGLSSTTLTARLVERSGANPSSVSTQNISTSITSLVKTSIQVVQLSTNTLLATWGDVAGTNKAAVITVSGSSISVGPIQTIGGFVGYADYAKVVALSSTECIMVGTDSSGGDLAAVGLDISGNTVTTGTKAQISSSYTTALDLGAYNTTSAVACFVQTGGDLIARTITKTGTTLNLGTNTSALMTGLSTNDRNKIEVMAPTATSILVVYTDKFLALTVSGTALTTSGTVHDWNTSYVSEVTATILTDSTFMTAHRDASGYLVSKIVVA